MRQDRGEASKRRGEAEAALLLPRGCLKVRLQPRDIHHCLVTDCLLIGLPKQLFKTSDPTHVMPSNVTVSHANCARNLGVICDSSLTMSDHISSVSIFCFFSFVTFEDTETLLISPLHTLLPHLIHSKGWLLCNSQFINLPQLDRLQLALNFAGCAVSKTPKILDVWLIHFYVMSAQ